MGGSGDPAGPCDALVACSNDGGRTFGAPASARGGPADKGAYVGALVIHGEAASQRVVLHRVP